MPGIRDEIRPHLLGSLQRRDVVTDQQRDRAVERRPVDPRELSAQYPIGRSRPAEFDAALRVVPCATPGLAAQHRIDGRQ